MIDNVANSETMSIPNVREDNDNANSNDKTQDYRIPSSSRLYHGYQVIDSRHGI